MFDLEMYIFAVKTRPKCVFLTTLETPLQKDGNSGGAIAPELFPSFGRDVNLSHGRGL